MADVPRVPTSVLLEGLMHEAPAGTVSLGWLVERLGIAGSVGFLDLGKIDFRHDGRLATRAS